MTLAKMNFLHLKHIKASKSNCQMVDFLDIQDTEKLPIFITGHF